MLSIKLFLSTFLYIIALDMIWISYLGRKFYAEGIGTFLRKTGENLTPIWPAAIMVYILISIGIICFVLPKANGNYMMALAWGVLFGLVGYGFYDFTNYAIIENWPLKITLIDLCWGMTICGLSSAFACYIQKWLHG